MAGAFTARSAIAWGLGDYDTPELQFNGVDEFGVEWICGTPDGWLTTTGDVPMIDNPGDGATFSPGRRKPKVLTLRGAFRCADITQMDAATDRLQAAAEHFRTDTLLWHGQLPTGAVPKQMSVRLAADLTVLEVDGNSRIRTFTAVFTAADPLKYAAGAAGLLTYTTGLPQVTGSVGVGFPLGFPANFGGLTGTVGRIAAVNPGSQPVYPRVVYSGPVDGPVLHHLDRGQAEGVNRVLLPGSTVVVDHRLRSILADGASVFYQRIEDCVFFPLVSGTNYLTFSANAYTVGALATVTFRPAWS